VLVVLAYALVIVSTSERQLYQKAPDGASNGAAVVATVPASKDDDADAPDESDALAGDAMVLPRTASMPYGDMAPGRRYVIYGPSGGFANQRYCLENALLIGRLLNRTVLVPPIAKHTSYYNRYELLSQEHVFPADRVLDFELMNTLTPAVPVSKPLLAFVRDAEAAVGKEQITRVFYEENPGWQWKYLLTFRPNKRKLLFFRGAILYHSFSWNSGDLAQVRRHVRLAPAFRRTALQLIDWFGGRNFNAVHSRLGDYVGTTPSATYFFNKAVAANFPRNAPLYVATEPNPPRNHFAPLCGPGKFKCVFSSNLDRNITLAFKRAFPKGQIRSDMLGLIEILLCVAAKRFIGTDISTFSQFILESRKQRRVFFPEIVDTSAEESTTSIK